MTLGVQSIVLFATCTLLFITPHMWDDTYANLYFGAPLPALTDWIRQIVPKDSAGSLGLATMLSITHFCLGLVMIASSPSESIATQKIHFLLLTTIAVMILAILIFVVAQVMPFVSIISQLATAEEIEHTSRINRYWFGLTSIYCIIVLATTTWYYQRQKRVEHKPPEGRGAAPRP